MSEFKGTKGKWRMSDGDIGTQIKVDFDIPVCLMATPKNRNSSEWKANALLISKAPEMFEMLKEVSAGRIRPREYQSDWDMVNELIKSATELKEDK